MSEATLGSDRDLVSQFHFLSNWGAWGEEDQRGTVNYVDQTKVLSALRIPRHGVAVGLGRDLFVGRGHEDQEGQFSSLTSQVNDAAVTDEWTLSTHGFGMTHLDALGHTVFEDRIYGGRSIGESLGPDGLAHASVMAFGSGIVTRGVLLDITLVRNVEYLEQGDGVTSADLEAAAKLSGVEILPGDAVFVRVGLGVRRARHGFDGDNVRTGLVPDVTNWLKERRVAVYSGDCIEQLPSGDARMSHPLHQIGQVSMGLCTLDIPDVERLAAACAEFGMAEFLLIIAPLRVHGASGSPVNPIAVF